MDKERRIEKLLRAFAKKRKADAGAPLEMPPGTRRLLQGEVARRLKTRPTTEQAWWRFWFGTPQRAFAVCALLSLLISGTVFLTTMKPSKPGMDLAKNSNRVPAGEPKSQSKVDQTIEPVPVASAPAPEMPAPASPPPPATVAMADRKEADTGLTHGGGGGAGGAAGFGIATTPPASASAPTVAYDDAAKNTTTFALNGTTSEDSTLQKNESVSGVYKDTLFLTNSYQGSVAGEGALTAAPVLDAGNLFMAEAKTPQSTSSVMNLASVGAPLKNMEALRAKNEMPMQQFYRLRAATDNTDGAVDKSRAVSVVKKSSAGDVLDSFSVAQDGNKITMVDSDGSQYTGFVQPVRVSGASKVATDLPTPAAKPSRWVSGLTSAGSLNTRTVDLGGAQNFAFKVTGTNVSLKQLVVFSGNFVMGTNGLVTNAVATGMFGPQPVLENSRIEGRAAVGGKKTEVKIEAAPARP